MNPITVNRSGSVTRADTNAAQLPNVPARLAVLQAPTGNTGTVTILGIDPTTGTIDAAGIVLAKGDPPLTLWVTNLNQLAYKLSSANDTLNYLVGR